MAQRVDAAVQRLLTLMKGLPISYQKDWAIVRQVSEAAGQSFNRDQYDKEAAKEAAKKK